MGDTGFEQPPKSSTKTHFLDQGGAKSGAIAEIDPDLAALVAAWPTLPEPIRRAMLALIASTNCQILAVGAPERPDTEEGINAL